MGRISRQQMFMGFAHLAAQRATCFRLNVGAVVVQNNNPISVGYNGQAPGADHCQGNSCAGIVPGMCGTQHAEVNALAKASQLIYHPDLKLEHRTVDLYCTNSPCRGCCEYMVNDCGLHVKRVFFEIPYRDTSHLGMLSLVGREVYIVTPAGYTVDYFTNKVVDL